MEDIDSVITHFKDTLEYMRSQEWLIKGGLIDKEGNRLVNESTYKKADRLKEMMQGLTEKLIQLRDNPALQDDPDALAIELANTVMPRYQEIDAFMRQVKKETAKQDKELTQTLKVVSPQVSPSKLTPPPKEKKARCC